MKVVSFKVDRRLYELLEMYVESTGETKSQLVRRLLKNYLEEWAAKHRPTITKTMIVWAENVRGDGRRRRARKTPFAYLPKRWF